MSLIQRVIYKIFEVLFRNDKNSGSTEIWTRIAEFRDKSGNHYTRAIQRQ